MSDYETLVNLIGDERIDAGLAQNKDIGFKFALGMTRYVWRYGCLSDGHERITDAQRYFAANRELYSVSNSLEDQRFNAMIAKADLLDAETKLSAAVTESDKLRAAAAIGSAKSHIRRALDNCQDLLRGLDELCKIKNELEPSVMAQYPDGIEQAEPDNWEAVARYRLEKEKVPGMARQQLDSVPMPPERKALLGYATGRMDCIAPLMISNEQKCREIAGAFEKMIENKSQEAS